MYTAIKKTKKQNKTLQYPNSVSVYLVFFFFLHLQFHPTSLPSYLPVLAAKFDSEAGI